MLEDNKVPTTVKFVGQITTNLTYPNITTLVMRFDQVDNV